MGEKKDNQEHPAKDDRSIDELVEFISGQTEKKKKRKRRKNAVQSVPAQNIGTTTNTLVLKVNNDNIKKETNDDSDTLETSEVNIMDELHDFQSKNYAQYMELIELEKVKMDLEGKIDQKNLQFVSHQQKAGDVIHIKSGKIKDIVMNLEKSQNEKGIKVEKN